MKKTLKIFGVAILVFVMTAGLLVTLVFMNILHVFVLIVSNQMSDSVLITDSEDVAPVYVEVSIDNRAVFEKEVHHNELEDLLGAGAGGGGKWLFLFGQDHTITVTTDNADVPTLESEFQLEKAKQFGVIEIKPQEVMFWVKDQLNLY